MNSSSRIRSLWFFMNMRLFRQLFHDFAFIMCARWFMSRILVQISNSVISSISRMIPATRSLMMMFAHNILRSRTVHISRMIDIWRVNLSILRPTHHMLLFLWNNWFFWLLDHRSNCFRGNMARIARFGLKNSFLLDRWVIIGHFRVTSHQLIDWLQIFFTLVLWASWLVVNCVLI